MRSWCRIGVASALCLPVMAVAQRPAAAGQAGSLRLHVVVSDAAGTPVSGLGEQDFTLLDNGKPIPIESFRAYGASGQKPSPPVQVILLIDTVNLEFEHVAYVRQEVQKFLRQNGGRLGQPVSVFLMTDDAVDVINQPSTDGNAIAAKLAQVGGSLRALNRSAGDYGAGERFQISLKMLSTVLGNEVEKPGHKLLIWISPGWPWLPDADLEQQLYSVKEKYFQAIVGYSELVRQADTTLYSVSLGDPNPLTFLYQGYLKGVRSAGDADTGNLSLKVLAVQSGGLALDPDSDLPRHITQCVRDASAYYTLRFVAPRAGKRDEYHALKVRLDRKGLTARTTTGYYDELPAKTAP